MALKDILVHLDDSKACAQRLDAAVGLASNHDAHLTGLYVLPQFNIPAYVEVQIPVDVIAAQKAEARAEAKQAETRFRAAVDGAGRTSEWRCVEGDIISTLNLHAHYVDLVVVGQTDESGAGAAGVGIDEQLILGSARPVLCIPYIGASGAIGKRVMVAWNGSREAVRAINDALPLLKRAEAVDVVAVNPAGAEDHIPSADICLHLARHGVKAEASHIVAKDLSIGDTLLSRAADESIDLIVMGAYGHSRLREYVLGGATRHLLEHMTVPVLMSH